MKTPETVPITPKIQQPIENITIFTRLFFSADGKYVVLCPLIGLEISTPENCGLSSSSSSNPTTPYKQNDDKDDVDDDDDDVIIIM